MGANHPSTAPPGSGAPRRAIGSEPQTPAGKGRTRIEHQVYQAHRARLPPLGRYFGEVWRRREFATQLARTQLRSQHANTALGQLWLILDPLLLSLVYFVLIKVVSGGRGDRGDLAHIMSGLFLFYYFMGCIRSAATSVTSGGKLILNLSFPRLLLPLSAIYQSWLRFLPTMAVYAVFHVVFGRPITPQLLVGGVVVALITALGLGLGLLMATAQVYFRDSSNLLPYALRIWMYLSPVLWSAADLQALLPGLGSWAYLNPLYSVFTLWADALNGQPVLWLNLGIASAWAVGALIVGAVVFLSREREFSVRI